MCLLKVMYSYDVGFHEMCDCVYVCVCAILVRVDYVRVYVCVCVGQSRDGLFNLSDESTRVSGIIYQTAVH